MSTSEILLPKIYGCPICGEISPYLLKSNATYDLSLSNEANIVKHLLERCLPVCSHVSRHSVIRWILNYFYDIHRKNFEPFCRAPSENSLTNRLLRKHIFYQKRTLSVRVLFSEASQCVLCGKYFTNSSTNFYHLFHKCILMGMCKDSDEADIKALQFSISYWLIDTFFRNTYNLRTFLVMYGISHSTRGFTDEIDSCLQDEVMCFLCSSMFPDNDAIRSHLASCHLDSKKRFRCPRCGTKINAEQEDVLSHILRCWSLDVTSVVTPNILYRQCQLCDLTLLVTKLDEHLCFSHRNDEHFVLVDFHNLYVDDLLKYQDLLLEEDSKKLKSLLKKKLI